MAINRDKVEAAAIKLLQQGKYDKAIVELRKLVDDDKTDVRTLLKLGDTYVKMGNKKESIDSYERAAAIYTEQGFYLKAVAVFKQILRVDNNVPELHLKLAELYQQLGLTSDALQHYQNVAVFYEQQARPRDALDMLKRMVDLDPDNIASRIKLGELFAQQGLAAEATQELRSALSFLKQQQRFDDYVRVGEKLVAYDGGALDVARDLAQIYMQRQQPSVALGKLQMCFKADPRNVEILALIAQAFLEMQQVPKTVSVFKEMAKIYSADGKNDLATRTWERVLELAAGDEEAQQALGRASPQVTRPTLAATVVAPAMAGAPMQQPAVSAAPARANPEDEQLQRLLTETDVYVKYGLREKAIEHLQKVFALRADHVPALEKLKVLQQAIGGVELVDTLRQLVKVAEAQGHARVLEWRAELQRAEQPPRPTTHPSIIIPLSQSQPSQPSRAPVSSSRPRSEPSQSGEGEFIITDDPSHPSSPPVDEPLAMDEPLDSPSGVMQLGSDSSAVHALDDESFLSDEGASLEGLPPDEHSDLDEPAVAAVAAVQPQVPRMPTGLLSAPTPLRAPPVAAPPPLQPMPSIAFAPTAKAPVAVRPVLDEPMALDEPLDQNDADALVRRALQDISAEDMEAAADELLLEPAPEDIMPVSGEGAPVEDDFQVPTGASKSPLTAALTSASPSDMRHTAATMSGHGGHSEVDEDEIDRLAREAVADASNAVATDVAATALMALSPAQLADLANPNGDNDSGFSSQREFNDPTLALRPQRSSDMVTDERPRLGRPTMTQPSVVAVPEAAAAKPVSPAKVAAAAPPPMLGELDEEFDPSSFDLPPDVKEMLRKGGSADDESSLPELDVLAAPLSTSVPAVAVKAATVAAPPAHLPPELELDNSADDDGGEITLRGKLGLADKAHGFEDDPANQFFPDELEESEFFIQQELLDEAKEILTSILDDVPESLRVQWMLARITAKENGEAEPPAPWEQRILEEVQQQLDDLGIADEPGKAEPKLGDGTAQVSVEEVLSQFKKGIAETVPEDDAATHYELGIAYREMGLQDDAVNEFQIAGRAVSRAADARYMIGLVRKEQGNLEAAVKAFEDAIAQPQASRDQKGAAEYDRASCLEELGRPKDALRALQSAKASGHMAPDIDRRIAALVASMGDDDGKGGGGPKGGANGQNGSNGHGKTDKPTGGRGPKNIDYV